MKESTKRRWRTRLTRVAICTMTPGLVLGACYLLTNNRHIERFANAFMFVGTVSFFGAAVVMRPKQRQ